MPTHEELDTASLDDLLGWGVMEVFEDDSNNGGYYTKCLACDWESPRENFRGSAKLRLTEHITEETNAPTRGST